MVAAIRASGSGSSMITPPVAVAAGPRWRPRRAAFLSPQAAHRFCSSPANRSSDSLRAAVVGRNFAAKTTRSAAADHKVAWLLDETWLARKTCSAREAFGDEVRPVGWCAPDAGEHG